MSIRELLDEATKKIISFGKEERAAYELLKEIASLESYELYNKLDDTLDKDIIDRFEKNLDHYLKGIPLQHILGYEMFFGRDFIVNENVLIPRYETEELVENILYHIDDYFEEYSQITVADIGTGSGAIAISLDLEEDKTKVYGSDISQNAIEVAYDNNDKLGAKVEFFKGDMLEPFIKNDIKLDILVSNPPYIPNEEFVDESVKGYEPHLALFGGSEGLDFYTEIFKNASKVINDRCLLAFEIGYAHKEAITKEVEKYFPGCEFEILKDINGKDRMLFIYHNIKR
ncbi:MAG: peptide chain release factor N(5)-glutamine methyltransferase [Erysipelotrichales bacterium]